MPGAEMSRADGMGAVDAHLVAGRVEIGDGDVGRAAVGGGLRADGHGED